MKTKPVTPYARLLEAAHRYTRATQYPARKTLWVYPKAKLQERWVLHDLWERVRAANLLDHDTRIRATDEGLVVEFVKRAEVPAVLK